MHSFLFTFMRDNNKNHVTISTLENHTNPSIFLKVCLLISDVRSYRLGNVSDRKPSFPSCCQWSHAVRERTEPLHHQFHYIWTWYDNQDVPQVSRHCNIQVKPESNVHLGLKEDHNSHALTWFPLVWQCGGLGILFSWRRTFLSRSQLIWWIVLLFEQCYIQVIIENTCHHFLIFKYICCIA